MDWMWENRYAQYGYLRECSLALFNCKGRVLEQYVSSLVAAGMLEIKGAYVCLPKLPRQDGETFPWEGVK